MDSSGKVVGVYSDFYVKPEKVNCLHPWSSNLFYDSLHRSNPVVFVHYGENQYRKFNVQSYRRALRALVRDVEAGGRLEAAQGKLGRLPGVAGASGGLGGLGGRRPVRPYRAVGCKRTWRRRLGRRYGRAWHGWYGDVVV